MKVRKKPVVVDAWNIDDLLARATSGAHNLPQEVVDAYREGVIEFEVDHLIVATLEGVMHGPRGWYLIRGVNGEFYPCEGDIFARTYEEVAATETGYVLVPKPDVPGPYDHSPEV